jgi:hypothetical protein
MDLDMTNDTMLENGAFTPSVRKALTQRVRLSLRKAEEHTSGLQKTNSRLLVVGIVSSSAATFVAGFTAANGPVVGEGTAGWIIACLVAAAFSFATTVCIGLHQQLRISDRLSKWEQCVVRLRALYSDILTGSRSWEEVIKEYSEIARSYPEPIRSG